MRSVSTVSLSLRPGVEVGPFLAGLQGEEPRGDLVHAGVRPDVADGRPVLRGMDGGLEGPLRLAAAGVPHQRDQRAAPETAPERRGDVAPRERDRPLVADDPALHAVERLVEDRRRGRAPGRAGRPPRPARGRPRPRRIRGGRRPSRIRPVFVHLRANLALVRDASSGPSHHLCRVCIKRHPYKSPQVEKCGRNRGFSHPGGTWHGRCLVSAHVHNRSSPGAKERSNGIEHCEGGRRRRSACSRRSAASSTRSGLPAGEDWSVSVAPAPAAAPGRSSSTARPAPSPITSTGRSSSTRATSASARSSSAGTSRRPTTSAA